MADQESSIFVGGISWDTTTEQVEAAFTSRYKTITSVKLIPDPMHAARHRGYGFVRFSSPQEATQAISEMNGYVLNGMKLRVGASEAKGTRQPAPAAYPQQPSYYPGMPAYPPYNPYMMGYAMPPAPAIPYAPPPTADEGLTTLFAGGVDGSISEYDLFVAFSTVGPVSSVKIASARSCAFIQFQYHTNAERAMITLQGLQLGSCRLRLAWGRNQAFSLPGAGAEASADGAATNEPGKEAETKPVEVPSTPQISNTDVLNQVFSAAPIMAAAAVHAPVSARAVDEEFVCAQLGKQRDALREYFFAYLDDGDATKGTDINSRNNAWAMMYDAMSAPADCMVPRGSRMLADTNMCTLMEQAWPSDLHDTVMQSALHDTS